METRRRRETPKGPCDPSLSPYMWMSEGAASSALDWTDLLLATPSSAWTAGG
jgi:hypothetical protein